MAGRILTVIRLARVAHHLIYGLCVGTAVYPFISRPSRRRIQQRWSQRLLSILGVRLPPVGQDCGSGLLVANHISWLDVFAISSLAPASFVCKSEVRDWPLIGLLCERTDTIFIERASRSAALRVSQTLAGKLREGDRIAVFPEGSTSEGATLLPFRGALLHSAILSESLVQPLALRYLDTQGRTTTVPAYCGETTFWQSLCAIASAPGMTASIEMLETITAQTRKDFCEKAHAQIKTCLERPLPSLAPQTESRCDDEQFSRELRPAI